MAIIFWIAVMGVLLWLACEVMQRTSPNPLSISAVIVLVGITVIVFLHTALLMSKCGVWQVLGKFCFGG